MAMLRSKQKAQVIEKLTQVAPPGETFIATVHCETGPSPWLNALFDEVPLLGLIVALTRRFYFLTLTNTSVVVNTASRFRRQPGEVVVSFHRDQVPFSNIVRGRVWSKLYLQFPGSNKPTRLNVSRYWRSELDQFIAAMPAQQVAAAETVAPEPPK